MRKNILAQIPWPNLEPSENNEDTAFYMTAEIHYAEEEVVLCCTFLTNPSFYHSKYYYRWEPENFRVFTDGQKYITQWQSGKWSRACIRSLLPWGFIRQKELVLPATDADSKTAADFFECSSPGHIALHDFQQSIMGNNLKLQHKRKAERLARIMNQIAEEPEDLQTYIDRSVFSNSAYIYYRRRTKKVIGGYCTWCQSDVQPDSATHNAEGICPNCGKEIVFKAIGKSKRIVDAAKFAYMQKIHEGILIRMFDTQKRYMETFRDPEFSVCESNRLLYMPGTSTFIAYAERYNYSESRREWYQLKTSEGLAGHILYPHNLKAVLHETQHERFHLDRLAATNIPLDVIGFFKNPSTIPVIEYLIKTGFLTMASELVNQASYRSWGLNKSGKGIAEVLGLSKQEIRIFQQSAPEIATEGLKLYKVLKGAQVEIPPKTLPFMNKLLYREREILELLNHMSFQKLVNYVKKQKRSHSSYAHLITTYYDYLRMAKTLKYPLADNRVLFPKNLKKQHDRVATILENRKNAKLEKAFRKHCKEADVLYAREDKHYILRAPKSQAELIAEGKALRHCVGSYAERVAKGETTILLVREKKKSDVPFYTLEVRDGRVIQCRGIGNKGYTSNKTLTQFIETFQQSLKKQAESA